MRKGQENWIPMNECKDGYLYIIDARNGTIGIYDSSKKYFWLSRFKFNDNFLYPEDHWDIDEHGTAKPLKEIEKTSFYNINEMDSKEKDILKYLNDKRKELNEEIHSLIGGL